MTNHDFAILFRAIGLSAPWLVGGDIEEQQNRAALLDEWLGSQVTLADALHAFGALVRKGAAKDNLTWPAITAGTLEVMRRRLDTRTQTLLDGPDPDELIPMPADFRQQVTYWRDKARAQALTVTCPTCQAPPGSACDTNTSSTTINEAGNHYPRQNYGVQHTRPSDHLTRRR